jgi:hypothetical protein
MRLCPTETNERRRPRVQRYRRSVPLTIMSLSRLPHCEHTSLAPFENVDIGAIAADELGRVRLDLVAAFSVPHD